MQRTTIYQSITWIDLTNPTHEEVFELMERYNLSHRIAEELLVTTPRPRVDVYKDHVYLVMHFPVISDTSRGGDTSEEREIDFIIGADFLITVHYTTIEAILEFEKLIKVSNLLEKDLGNGGGLLFYHLVKLLYRDIESSLMDAHTALKHIETNIFKGEEAAMVESISQLNRRLLDHRRSLRFQGMTLGDLATRSKSILGENFTYYVERLGGNYHELMNILDSAKQTLDDLKTTDELLLNTKNNEIMKMLTILAFMLLPLSIGIDLIKFVESLGEHPKELLAISIMTVVSITTLYFFFKKKRWI